MPVRSSGAETQSVPPWKGTLVAAGSVVDDLLIWAPHLALMPLNAALLVGSLGLLLAGHGDQHQVGPGDAAEGDQQLPDGEEDRDGRHRQAGDRGRRREDVDGVDALAATGCHELRRGGPGAGAQEHRKETPAHPLFAHLALELFQAARGVVVPRSAGALA